MIYQWYTGTDSSREVPRRLTRLNQGTPPISPDEAIAVLEELVQIEREPNWRAYLFWKIGRYHLDQEQDQKGLTAFFKAYELFDPFLASIRELKTEYCDTMFQLILRHFFDRAEAETVAELAFSLAMFTEEIQFGESQKGTAFFFLGFALEMLAEKHSLAFLRRLALASYLKWHRTQPENASCLEHLAVTYLGVGDVGRSRAVIDAYREVAPPGQQRDRLEEFVRANARALRT